MKSAQSVLGHTDARVTLDLYAQVVIKPQQAARFLATTLRGERRMEVPLMADRTAPNTDEKAVGWGRSELPTAASRSLFGRT